jgi:hypothetical protein
MKDPKEALVNNLMERAFKTPRAARSLEYRQGVRAVFEFRVLGKRINLIYTTGSVQSDAFFAGTSEGHLRWRDYQEELKDAAAKSETNI